VTVKEGSKVDRDGAIHEVKEQVRTTVARDADWELVGEVPERLRGRHSEPEVREFVRPERRCALEVLHFLAFGAEPSKAAFREHSVKEHQTFDRSRQGCRSSVSVVRFAHGAIERLALNVIEAGSSMRRGVWRRELLGDQVREEVVDLLTANDPGIDAVLATHAHASMDEHGDEESRLPLGESELRDRPNLLGARH
jgi:hypothetical protein